MRISALAEVAFESVWFLFSRIFCQFAMLAIKLCVSSVNQYWCVHL